jgi:hypothetical protein
MKELIERLLKMKAEAEAIQDQAEAFGLQMETCSGLYVIQSNIDEVAGFILLEGVKAGKVNLLPDSPEASV